MLQNKDGTSGIGITVMLLVFLNAIIAKIAFIKNENLYWVLVITLPLLLIAIYKVKRKKKGFYVISLPIGRLPFHSVKNKGNTIEHFILMKTTG